jgi:hypothetical protein
MNLSPNGLTQMHHLSAPRTKSSLAQATGNKIISKGQAKRVTLGSRDIDIANEDSLS